MTDTEKIERIVQWMGGLPDRHREDEGIKDCNSFNPFERIEDAFLVVEKLGDGITLRLSRGCGDWWECWINESATLNGGHYPPARAITEAAYEVIEHLTQEKQAHG